MVVTLPPITTLPPASVVSDANASEPGTPSITPPTTPPNRVWPEALTVSDRTEVSLLTRRSKLTSEAKRRVSSAVRRMSSR